MPESHYWGRMLGCAIGQVNRGWVVLGDKKPGRILFRDQDLVLAQKIEFSVTTGPRINDGRKIPEKIMSANFVHQT
jgi:hypothetical protein